MVPADLIAAWDAPVQIGLKAAILASYFGPFESGQYGAGDDYSWEWAFKTAAMSNVAAFIANLLRISLSFAFLVSVLYVRVIRRVLIWLWSAVIRPENLLFTPPSSALAALILIVDRWSDIVAAMGRQFA